MYRIKPLPAIKEKTLSVPPDKSISHRAAIIASIACNKTTIRPFLRSNDTLATLDCLRQLGVPLRLTTDNSLIISGVDLFFPSRNKVVLNAQESGTTMRILSGLLAAQKFPTRFEAAGALSNRPMGRIVMPLRKMGAAIDGLRKTQRTWDDDAVYPPLEIQPVNGLNAVDYHMPMASAQVKSAILLASLYAEGQTVITEPHPSRDHTERMLSFFGVPVKTNGTIVRCNSIPAFSSPGQLFIPGDFSSAAFFIVLALLLKKSSLCIRTVNTNPTRTHLLAVLRRMGAKIALKNAHDAFEPYADIYVQSSDLNATTVEPSEIPLMIDEIPVLCVAAAFAHGTTYIKGVEELRVKETDRIASMVQNLQTAGVNIAQENDGKHSMIVIGGKAGYRPGKFKSYSDHRTAMSMVIFGMALDSPSLIEETLCISKSFPEFISTIQSLY